MCAKSGVVLLALNLCISANGFYLPGVAPKDYTDGEKVDMKVNKLDSVKTQLPYDFYSLPFCQPPVIEEAAENLGEILGGDRIETSNYEVSMKLTEACKILCKRTYTKEEMKQFEDKIEEEYRVNWIIDNIPAATKFFFSYDNEIDLDDEGSYNQFYEKGFPLGFIGDGEKDEKKSSKEPKYINNHHRLILFYHEDPNSFQGFRIVGFEVEAYSVQHQIDGEWKGNRDTKLKTCTPLKKVTGRHERQTVSQPMSKEQNTIIWTYDVQWEPSPVKWASRWDLYFKMTDARVHWFSISNSIMIVLFLSGMVGMILMRALHKDLARYNEMDLTEEEQAEETGWKLIHGEVFRPPENGAIFATIVGTGAQVFAMTVFTLIFALFGFLSPANRGGLMTALLLLYVFMGMVAGYVSTRVFKMFRLTEWRSNTLMTALLFPGTVFGIFFVLNLFVWGEKSSGAVPFATLAALLVLWLGISVPLVYLGSYYAFKKPAIEPPIGVNNIPRDILLTDTNWSRHPLFTCLLGGIMPFGAVFIELFFIMTSVWLNQFYYVFGILSIVFVILIISCAEITIILIYFQLCQEDYNWWWKSIMIPGTSALYVFLYSFVYFFTKLEIIKFVSGMLFFGYMLLVSLAFFLLTGTIGFFSSYYFIRKIYSSIKID